MSYPKYDSYKDSGVDWLGVIPVEWELVPNKYLFKIKNTKVGKKSSEYELLSLTLKGIIKRDMDNPEGKFPAEFDTYQEVKKNDFIFCLFDVQETPRTVGLSSFDGMITGAYTVFEINKNYDSRFFYYFYLNIDNDKRFKSLYRGLRNTIPKEWFMSFKSFVPILKTQTAIADFLDGKTAQIDQAINLKQQQIDKLNEYKQIVIQNAVTKGLNPTVPMKHSGVDWIGDIPQHWDVKKLKFLCRFDTGNKDTVNAISDGIYPLFVRSQNIERINEFTHDCEAVLTAGDGAGVGKVFHYFVGKFSFHQRVYMFNQFRNLYGKYFYYYFSSLFYKVALDGSAKSTVDSLRRPMIANFPIAYPNKDEQNAIIKYLDEKLEKFNIAENSYQNQIERLKEYKNILINQAVTGKIKIA